MEVIVFSKKDCAPCERLKAVIEDFKEEYPSVVWTIIDYDENPEMVKFYNITKTPTSVMIKSNSVINIIVGVDFNKINSTLRFMTSSIKQVDDF